MGIEITRDELKKLNNALDYLIDVIRDVTARANDVNTRIQYLHESNRIYELATNDIKRFFERSKR